MDLQWWVTEALVEYAVGAIVMLMRVFARTKAVGFKRWQGDDYLILIAFVLYTAEAGLWYGISLATNLNIDPSGPTPSQLQQMRASYKVNFVVWPIYVTFIWCLKGCILFFYSRLTFGLWQRKLVKVAAWMCAVTYVACILELFLHCLPIELNWIVRPFPGSICGSGLMNYYVVGSLNLVTDAVLLCIPLPLMFRVRLPGRKKLLLGLLLGSGVFIMLATLVRNILGLLSIQTNVGIKNKGFVISWALRENFVALLVVNIPCIYPLFNQKSRSSWLNHNKPCQPIGPSTHARSDSYNQTRSSMALALEGGRSGNRSSVITANYPNRCSYYRAPSPYDIEDCDSEYEVEMPKRPAMAVGNGSNGMRWGEDDCERLERLEIYTSKTVAVSGGRPDSGEMVGKDDVVKGLDEVTREVSKDNDRS